MYGYFIPTANLMGAGAASEVGKQAKTIGGSKALVVTDKPLVKIGIADKIVKLLHQEGIKTVFYDDVKLLRIYFFNKIFCINVATN